jgi:hypothetical protein
MLLPKPKRKIRVKNPSLPMSLKPKISWVVEEEEAHHRKLKNLMGGEGWLMIFLA